MSPETQGSPEVSVVIASVESKHSIAACLQSVEASLAGIEAEVFVVDASRDKSADIAEQNLGRGRVIRCAPGTLTPELWAIGIARTTGRIVALTTGHFVMDPTWISSLMRGLREGTAGVGGRIDLAARATPMDWAVFYLRYSEFLSEPVGAVTVRGIAADNAAYDGESVRRFVRARPDGFWEVEHHGDLHAAGLALAMVPGATGRFTRSFPFHTILSHRFHHGRHAGAWRASRGDRSAAAIVFAAPLVPLLLGLRVWGRVRALAAHRTRFLRSLPAFLVLAASWAAGEAVGALAGAPSPRQPAAAPA